MLEISGESWDSNSAEDYQSLSEHSIMTVTSCGSTMEPHSDHLEYSFNRNNDQTHGNYDSDNTSENSEHSKPSLETNAASSQTKNRDDIPNTFLALKGISIANFNMGCNFHIAAAFKLIADYDISILAIQEHTPWNKELSHIEITCIERSCENYGFFMIVSKMQILIIDKQLKACFLEAKQFMEGRIICHRFEIAPKKYVEFISAYGFPHSPSNRNSQNEDQNRILQEMRTLSNHLRSLIINAQRTNTMIYIFGDLQDTPDNTRTCAYGSTKIPKHPLGIVKTCEDLGLECTIYQHLASMELPVVSRHGSKGGCFIDGMYTLPQYLTHITGIVIIPDTGEYSDHNLVISKCDLGLTKFSISKEKEERIDYRRVMAIPVKIYKDQDHPTLRDDVYKGLEFQDHANLYCQLQKIANDPQLNFSNVSRVSKSNYKRWNNQ